MTRKHITEVAPELADEPVDSGMSAEAVERAEWAWANLPTGRKWTSLSTHEKALACHTFASLRRPAPDALKALREARLQLAYLDKRFPTGTTPAVIARIDAALQQGDKQ